MIPIDNELKVTISTFRGKHDTTPTSRTGPWSKLVPRLTSHKPSRGKDTTGFNFAIFRDGGSRRDADVISVGGYVADFDNKAGQPITSIERVENELQSWNKSYVLYTTFSHTKAVPRFRVVIPYSITVSPGQHREVHKFFKRKFGKTLDNRAAESFFAYLPTYPADSPNAATYANSFQGNFLDPTLLPEYVDTNATPRAEAALQTVDINDLELPQNLRQLIIKGADCGDRSEAIYRAIAELKKAGCTPETALGILVDPDYGISQKPLEKGIDWTRTEVRRCFHKISDDWPRESAEVEDHHIEQARRTVSGVAEQVACEDLTTAAEACLSDELGRSIALLRSADFSAAKQFENLVRIKLCPKHLQLADFRKNIRRFEVLDSKSEGEAVSPCLPQEEPWPEPITSAELWRDLTTTIQHFVILPEAALVAASLYAIYTWLYEEFDVAPRLHVTAPEKASGKTTLASALSYIVREPYFASGSTSAAFFRVVDQFGPTTIIDEADSLDGDDDILAYLNSGHTKRAGRTPRCVGDDNAVTVFSTFGPVVLAGIGSLPRDTTSSRTIRIEMTRKLESEKVARLSSRSAQPLIDCQRKIARWAGDNREQVVAAIEPIEKQDIRLSDRGRDNWDPLFAVAKALGPDVLELTVKSALAIENRTKTQEHNVSTRSMLLEDIRTIFEQREDCDSGEQQRDAGDFYRSPWNNDYDTTDQITTASLITQLTGPSFADRPWSSYRQGKPICPRAMSNTLKEYNIRPKQLQATKSGKGPLRGYFRKDFEEAWERYL